MPDLRFLVGNPDLVLAESKALATPVLTHDFYQGLLTKLSPRWRTCPSPGRARLERYADTIRAWHSAAREATGPDPRFRLTTVAAQWRSLLPGADIRQLG